MRLPLITLVTSALSLTPVACGGTSTGNPVVEAPGFGNETSGCKKRSSMEVELTAPTFLGATPNEVLALALGDHAETLTWHPQSIASYGPESGERAVTVRVARTGEPEVVSYAFDSGGAEIAGDCPDRLEIPVRVELETDGGALNERFDAVLVATSPLYASIHHSPKLDALGGSFEVGEVNQTGFELAQLDLTLGFTQFGVSGALDAVFQSKTGDAVSAAPSNGPLASWGVARCSTRGHALPLDAALAGFSGKDVLSLLAGAANSQVEIGSAAPSSTALTFEMESEGACAQLQRQPFGGGTPIGTLFLYGTLTVVSADGTIDARWPVLIEAQPSEQDTLGEVSVKLDTDHPPRDDSRAPPYGIAGVDVASYDSASLALALKLAPGTPLQGTATVIGYTYPMCSTEVTQGPDGSQGSPGCPGATPTEVAVVTFSP